MAFSSTSPVSMEVPMTEERISHIFIASFVNVPKNVFDVRNAFLKIIPGFGISMEKYSEKHFTYSDTALTYIEKAESQNLESEKKYSNIGIRASLAINLVLKNTYFQLQYTPRIINFDNNRLYLGYKNAFLFSLGYRVNL